MTKLLPLSSLVLCLEAATADTYKLLDSQIPENAFSGDKTTAVVTITRAGTFTDPRYGTFSLTQEMFQTMIDNFKKGVFGQKIALDIAHNPEDGAAGYFTELFLDGNKLRGRVELTKLGIEAIKDKGYIYLSAEIHANYTDNETGEEHGPTLLGAGLVVRPCIKRLDPVVLSESDNEAHFLLGEHLANKLQTEIKMKFAELLKALKEVLATMKLSEDNQALFHSKAEAAVKELTDEKQAKAVIQSFEDAAKALAEAGNGDKSVTINLSAPSTAAGSPLTEEQVIALVDKREKDAAKKLAEQKQKKDNLVQKFNDAIDADKGLSDDVKKELKETASLINENMTEDQVIQLAQHEIKRGNQIAAAQRLQNLGFAQNIGGNIQLMDDPASEALKLQSLMHEQLKRTSVFAGGNIKLKEKVSPFVDMVLAEFDRQHAPQINKAVLALAGETTTSDTNLPVGFQREVIREALSDLNVLSLVQTLVDATATVTTQIPYETRDSSQILNSGIVFESNGIPRSKVKQEMDIAYILPMKIAFSVSNEVMHFTRTSGIQWDALGRNIATAARIIRELVCQRICNELQRASDSYQAADISGESVAGQLGGATSVIKTAQFPIVRPHQQRDLKGNAVGSEENPITITIDGAPVTAFDGSGNQAAGTYYVVTNYNLGYIMLVDESGAAVTPNAAAATVSYSYATNVLKLDSDVPSGVDADVHLNSLIRGVGARKALLSQERFVTPDFQLMSPILNDAATNAKQFEAMSKRNGSDTNNMGDLEAIKSIAAYGTNAPGVDLGDERILLGQRGAGAYTIAKPYSTIDLVEGRDANGTLNGTKEAYGEEYNSIKVPEPLRSRFTSIIWYSATNR